MDRKKKVSLAELTNWWVWEQHLFPLLPSTADVLQVALVCRSWNRVARTHFTTLSLGERERLRVEWRHRNNKDIRDAMDAQEMEKLAQHIARITPRSFKPGGLEFLSSAFRLDEPACLRVLQLLHSRFCLYWEEESAHASVQTQHTASRRQKRGNEELTAQNHEFNILHQTCKLGYSCVMKWLLHCRVIPPPAAYSAHRYGLQSAARNGHVEFVRTFARRWFPASQNRNLYSLCDLFSLLVHPHGLETARWLYATYSARDGCGKHSVDSAAHETKLGRDESNACGVLELICNPTWCGDAGFTKEQRGEALRARMQWMFALYEKELKIILDAPKRIFCDDHPWEKKNNESRRHSLQNALIHLCFDHRLDLAKYLITSLRVDWYALDFIHVALETAIKRVEHCTAHYLFRLYNCRSHWTSVKDLAREWTLEYRHDKEDRAALIQSLFFSNLPLWAEKSVSNSK